MRLQEDIDFTTLNWVKGELDETLKLARHALEAYISDPSDVSQMRFCATYLHQVQGTLRMVELYGAALVTEEMEQLAAAVQEQQVSAPEMAFEVLMDGIVQLPDYLERLQSGQKDIPVVLLPLLNRLRASRVRQNSPKVRCLRQISPVRCLSLRRVRASPFPISNCSSLPKLRGDSFR